MILGAEFTQAWANRFGAGIHPEPGAVRLMERTEPAEGPGVGTDPRSFHTPKR